MSDDHPGMRAVIAAVELDSLPIAQRQNVARLVGYARHHLVHAEQGYRYTRQEAVSETTEGVELAVPDESVQALLNINPYYDADDEAEADVRAVASSVVVAELRRLAEHYTDDARHDGGVEYVREGLHARANELEAQS